MDLAILFHIIFDFLYIVYKSAVVYKVVVHCFENLYLLQIVNSILITAFGNGI